MLSTITVCDHLLKSLVKIREGPVFVTFVEMRYISTSFSAHVRKVVM